MLTKLIFVGIILTINLCDGAKILSVVPTPAYSHQVALQPVWRELSLRGHQVTLLTTHPANNSTLSNLTEIDLSSSRDVWNEVIPMMVAANNAPSLKLIRRLITAIKELASLQLGNPLVQNLINNRTEHFDLLIIEVEFFSPAFLALAHRFNCPYIGILSYGGHTQVFESIGSPTHPVLYPDIMLGVYKNLTFLERFISSLGTIFQTAFTNLYFYPEQELIIKKFFGENYPPISQLMQNMHMLFLNTDPVVGVIRPLTPNVIRIGGGIHRKPPQPLPTDLQTLLDNAKDGFIYFSLGSTVKSQYLTEEMRKVILETFAELPYTILWKFELDVLPSQPKNVYISKWISQQDVLRHPNIKLFITQGGLQSLEEAIYNHVPFVGIPFFADQPANIKNMEFKGCTVLVDRANFTKENFKNSILEVIQNPSYRNKIMKLANLAQDEPMSGLQKAVWWTEYVLRHKGAKHLRSPALDIPDGFLLDRVVGGSDAAGDEFPYQASIRQLGWHICGASVIHERFILTAAHCLYQQDADLLSVVVGSSQLDSGGDTYYVEKLIVNEFFQPDGSRNDVGLIKLNSSIIFTKNVQKIDLAKTDTPPGTECVLTGWGRTSSTGTGPLPNNLQKIKLITISLAQCKLAYRVKNETQPDSGNICTLSRKGQGACFGDSGGPLVNIATKKQIGIVSHGTPCGVGAPDIYTNVYKYLIWITEKLLVA